MATTGIAQRNLEVARNGYAALDAQDMEAAFSFLADDVVVHVGGKGPFVGDYKGKASVVDYFTRMTQRSRVTFKAEIHDILANDQHTVVLYTETATRNGKTHTTRTVDIIHPDREGRVKEFWSFNDDPAARDAFLFD
jgi:uncharacterized protein